MRSFLLFALVGCSPFTSGDGPTEGGLQSIREAGAIRVATWNIEDVGAPGSFQYERALEVIERLRPDVFAINEIANSTEAAYFEDLAIDAGYPHTAVGEQGFGGDRNGFLSLHPLSQVDSLDGAALSGDPAANDVTRDFLRVTASLPTGDLTIVSMHWKSGSFHDSDRFRRSVEAHRSVQALTDLDAPAVLLGDLNDDIEDFISGPSRFTRLPSDIPSSYWLGDDLWDLMNDDGLRNAPFEILEDAGLEVVPARQLSGTDATRPVSHRRLDYLVTTANVEWLGHEVYDCHDEGREGGLEKFGSPLAGSTCLDAADHLPVLLDLRLPVDESEVIPADELRQGDVAVVELLANPAACADANGEWIELMNTSNQMIALDGLIVEDASGHGGLVSSAAVLAPGEWAVIVRGNAPCGAVINGTYGSGLSLNNGGDTVILSNLAGELDRVSYSSSAAQPERSWSFDGDSWCGGVPTPGESNKSCTD